MQVAAERSAAVEGKSPSPAGEGRGEVSERSAPSRAHRPSLPLRVRPYEAASDRAFVLSSWVRSHSHSMIGSMLGSRYESRWGEVAQRLLDTAATSVATSLEDPDVLVGFACVTLPGTLHYCFVKPFARQKGVTRLLLETAGVIAPFTTTHRTIDADRVAQKHPLRFDLTRLWLP